MLPGRKTLQILSQCAFLCLLRGALPGIHAEAVCHRDTKEGAARPAGHGREASAAACHKGLRSVAGWGGGWGTFTASKPEGPLGGGGDPQRRGRGSREPGGRAPWTEAKEQIGDRTCF